jgi:RNA polymerase sigma-70 factor, ECF subfamily
MDGAGPNVHGGSGVRVSERRPITDGRAADSTAATQDRDLVKRVRLGDGAAFGELVHRHIRPAIRLATRLLGDDAEAEDVVQDSFLAVLERVDEFDTARPFSPWFYRIVANRCANVRRSRSRRPTEALPPTLASIRPGPDQEAERSALRARLQTALAELPDRQREILLLYDVDGFSGPEIAGMLDISPGTVRWHLHQARAAMRVTLTDEEDG